MTVRPVEEMRLRAYEMRDRVKELDADIEARRHTVLVITIWEACAEICERLDVLIEHLATPSETKS